MTNTKGNLFRTAEVLILRDLNPPLQDLNPPLQYFDGVLVVWKKVQMEENKSKQETPVQSMFYAPAPICMDYIQ
jgi:hypothetical protein